MEWRSDDGLAIMHCPEDHMCQCQISNVIPKMIIQRQATWSVAPMTSFEARIAKHIIRLQKTKARQMAEQQRRAYYTAPGPSLHLLHSQITGTDAQCSIDKERKEMLMEYEIPRVTIAEGVLPQMLEENKMPKRHTYGGSLDDDIQMALEGIGINQPLSEEEGVCREISEEQDSELRRQEEETLRQEGLRRLAEEEDRRRYTELKRQEEEAQRRREELRRKEEEKARRQQEELEIRQGEEARRQEEEARRQEEELRKNNQGAQGQQCPKTRRFHPYMNARDRGESNHWQETDEVTFI